MTNKVNFSSENKGTWFYFNENDHDAGGVCLRELSTKRSSEIEKLTTKTKKKFKRGVAYDDSVVNEAFATKLQWDYCIIDWKNIQIDGQDVECNMENKNKLMGITAFVKFVLPCFESLSESNAVIDDIEEARLKNSGTISDGSETDPTE